jgi:hypothetical protein
MNTSRQSTFLSDVLGAPVIESGKLAYFRGRLANRIHALVLEEFARLEQEGRMTRADLARRISREPAQITRWLGSAGNWTFDTLSDLLLGMGCEPGLSIVRLQELGRLDAETEQLPNSPSLIPAMAAANEDLSAIPHDSLAPLGRGKRQAEPSQLQREAAIA